MYIKMAAMCMANMIFRREKLRLFLMNAIVDLVIPKYLFLTECLKI